MRRAAREVAFGLAVASAALLVACGSEFVGDTSDGGSGGSGGGSSAGSVNGGNSSSGSAGKGGSKATAGAGGKVGTAGTGGAEPNAGNGGNAGRGGDSSGGNAGDTSMNGGTAGTGGGPDPVECEVELLTNGGFDSLSVGWTQAAQPQRGLILHQGSDTLMDLGDQPVSPEYMALLGGYDYDSSSLSQKINVPANASVLLVSYYVHIHSDEGGGTVYDSLDMTLAPDANEAVPFATYTNNDMNATWELKGDQLDATPYRGKELTLLLAAVSDDDVDTHFMLDSFSIIAKVCDP